MVRRRRSIRWSDQACNLLPRIPSRSFATARAGNPHCSPALFLTMPELIAVAGIDQHAADRESRSGHHK